MRQRPIRGLPHREREPAAALVGYRRASSADDRQSRDLQRDAPLAAGGLRPRTVIQAECDQAGGLAEDLYERAS